MHEAGLLHAAVAALVAAAGDRPIGRVTLAIGPGVDRGAAEQAWLTAAAGGAAAAAVVGWEQAEDTLACLACGRQYHGDRLTRCPACGGDGLVVSPAREIEIVDWWSAGPPADGPPADGPPGETPGHPA